MSYVQITSYPGDANGIVTGLSQDKNGKRTVKYERESRVQTPRLDIKQK